MNFLRHGHYVRRARISEYFASQETRKIHLGSTHRLEGFLNSQILGEIPVDITRQLPFPDGSVDLVFSSHLIEHIHLDQGWKFLRECHRILKKGGVNIVATPSLDKYCAILYGQDNGKKDVLRERYGRELEDEFYTPCQQINLSMRAFGHRFLYDRFYMQRAAETIGYAGFDEVTSAEISERKIREYLDTQKPLRWHLETGIYVFEK